jgi:SAM-dependent methyltransferase
MNSGQPIAYDHFAPFYDRYMAHVNYDQWTEKVLQLFGWHSPLALHRIHELACGTANISERLVRQGYQVSASDRSPGMVDVAACKLYKPELRIADMLDALPEEAYQMVLCMFDSINYLLVASQIKTLLTNVAAALQTGGLFIFDISTLHNSLENFDGYINLDDTPEHLLIHQADFDEVTGKQKTQLTIFVRDGELYRRHDEIHRQRIYAVGELLSLIQNSPLACEGIYIPTQKRNLLRSNPQKLDTQYPRLFFVLKKI